MAPGSLLISSTGKRRKSWQAEKLKAGSNGFSRALIERPPRRGGLDVERWALSVERFPVQPSANQDAFDPCRLGLPHRPPFVFVQELITCDPGVAAECASTFDPADPMFAGHFPGNPLVPGVILTEALAQTAGIAAASGAPEGTQPRFLLSAIRQMKFFAAVRPGERITLRAERLGEVGDLRQFRVEAIVNGKQVAAGQIVLNAIPDTSPVG